jgi:hypothetical protein
MKTEYLIEQKQIETMFFENRDILDGVIPELSKVGAVSKIRLRGDLIETIPKDTKIEKSLIEKLKILHVSSVGISRDDSGELEGVRFIYSSSGSVLSGELRGVLYSRQIIKDSLYTDLEQFRKDLIESRTQKSASGYKVLQPNWYVFYNVDF